MLTQQERNRIYSEITTIKSRIGQIGSEIGQRRNKIESLKNDRAEYRDLHRTYSKLDAKSQRRAYPNEEYHAAVCNVERAQFNIQSQIDVLYAEIDRLYQEKNRLFSQKDALYQQLQNR